MDPSAARVIGAAREAVRTARLRRVIVATMLADSRALVEASRQLIRISRELQSSPLVRDVSVRMQFCVSNLTQPQNPAIIPR